MTAEHSATRTGRGDYAPAGAVCAALMVAMALPVSAREDLSEMGPRTNLQVTLWETGIEGERAALSELMFSFQHANPDVIVCLEWKDAQLQEEWIPRWMGDYRHFAPDVTVMSEQQAWKHRHELLELPEKFGRRLRTDFEPAVMRRLPGRARGVPWRVSTWALYYRPDLLEAEELEPPETLDDLVECAETLAKPPERFGLGMPGPRGGGEKLLHALARAVGPPPEEGEDAEADGEDAESRDAGHRARRENPDYAAALELLVEMQSAGALQPETLTWTRAELVDLFIDGRLAMLIAPMDATVSLRAAEEPPQWSVAPMPFSARGSGTLSVDWLVAFADTDRRENALRLMRYMAERESQRMLTMICSVPAMRDMVEELGGRQPWAGHVPALESGEGVPLPSWDRVQEELANALAWALSGRLTPREALAKARE